MHQWDNGDFNGGMEKAMSQEKRIEERERTGRWRTGYVHVLFQSIGWVNQWTVIK